MENNEDKIGFLRCLGENWDARQGLVEHLHYRSRARQDVSERAGDIIDHIEQELGVKLTGVQRIWVDWFLVRNGGVERPQARTDSDD